MDRPEYGDAAPAVDASAQVVSFVLGGRSGSVRSNVLAFSTDDGNSVVPANVSFIDTMDNARVRAVAFSPEQDLWVACGGRLKANPPDPTQALKWSRDGANWTAAMTESGFFSCQGVAWGFNSASRSGVWVAAL